MGTAMKCMGSVGLLLALCSPMLAQASTGVSCLIDGKLIKKERTIDQHEKSYTLRIRSSADDTMRRNDFKDCSTRFKKGTLLTIKLKDELNVRHTPRVFLNYVYGDDRGGARWESHTVIDKRTYKERQHGLLR